MNPLLVLTALILLHNVDNDPIYVNPDQVVVLHPTKDKPAEGRQKLVVGGVNCVVGLSNGKFVSVLEDCATVRKLMEEAR